jgi:hypothetical protein
MEGNDVVHTATNNTISDQCENCKKNLQNICVAFLEHERNVNRVKDKKKLLF